MMTYQRRQPFITTAENTTTITAASHAERVWVRPMPTSIRIADTSRYGRQRCFGCRARCIAATKQTIRA